MTLIASLGLNTSVLNPQLLEAGSDWDELAMSATQPSFFSSRSWVNAWWSILARGGHTRLAVATDGDGQVLGRVGMTELQTRRRPLPFPVRSTVILGSGPGAGDHMGPTLRSGAPVPADDLLWDWLDTAQGTLQFSAVARRLSEPHQRRDSVRVPYTHFQEGATQETAEAVWTGSRRRKVKKMRRTFADAGGEFVWFDQPVDILACFPELLRLHRKRMSELALRSFFVENDRIAFHDQLIRDSRPGNGAWLQIGLLQGEPVCALYGFHFGSTVHLYQSGWDSAAARFSIGQMQCDAAFQKAIQLGARTLDLCRGDDAYKLQYATGCVEEHTYILPRSFSGFVLGAQRNRWGASSAAPLQDNAAEVPS